MHKPKIHNIGIKDCVFGENIKIVSPVNLYGALFEENVFIGPFVEIQKNVKIGKYSKVQSHTFICENVSIGNYCFIGHGVCFINDKFIEGKPAQGNKELWGDILIGNNVSIGSNATILPSVVCDDVVIGAGSVVTKDITEPGVYAGNPARKIRGM
ncbi:N-acetyltransferase [Gammaproteobacteria bacterium]|nr:N-acetyltransferase [Gammaproteobacteria bacterium]